MGWRVLRSPRKWDSASNGGGGNSAGYSYCERQAAGLPAMPMPPTRESELSGGGSGKRLAGIGANALGHGAQAVGALRRQMFAKSEFVENRNCVGCKNFPRRMAGIQC